MIDASNRLKVWQLMQGQSGSSAMRVKFTPGNEGNPPIVSYHAINTKGTGGNNARVRAGDAGDALTSPLVSKHCAQGKHFKDATIVSKQHKDHIEIGSWSLRCDTSGDPSDPIVTVHLSLPSSSKATFQDMHFSSADGVTMISGGGPGGGPRVQARCAAADPSSDAADLLLPAVQK